MIIQPSKPIFPKRGLYCCIHLKLSEAPAFEIEKQATDEKFREQTYRHITIFGQSRGESIKAANQKLKDEEILTKLRTLIRKFDWKFTPKDIYRIKKEGKFGNGTVIEKRESFIRRIDMPDMEKFYEELNRTFNTNLPTQFPHITLFTRGERPNPDYYGIPIPSKEEFEKMNPKLIS